MNVVDSSAWLSYFANDDNAQVFAEPIENVSELLVPSITVTEVFKVVLHQRGEEAALIVTAHMEQGRVIPLGSELAMNAARLGLQHKLPLADSIIFATARQHAAVIWTQDNDFQGLPDVRYVSKSTG
ncbi:MAG: type II toxin-antitoxin system VapC family toxin [Natronospirillum sp.]|uniref:type II toxin-antitoxin system VapC family toxin n=1 Tax=Natronospirillum sp. TaxID=2812955 RepID=UPI0025FA9892|nr:type II toxin-antitoxin system VapC family toxin [Natronospirillum sp.]MCH8552919.1 type II toxin-antitoxin system VapC family toxin [Natronospirillum sp.]